MTAVVTAMQSTSGRAPTDGFYCSTSEAYFPSKEALAEHYRSDFHRYNLKRKVAGLPPVTRAWFDARKEQLSSAAGAGAKRVWFDPLTKKRFGSKNTYEAHVQSKRYQDLVRRSGQPAPEPQVSFVRKQPSAGPEQATAAPNTFVRQQDGEEARDHSDLSDAESDTWESVSEDGQQAGPVSTGQALEDDGSTWETWDPRRCLFDNHLSESLEANLEYMWRNFHFTIPDTEYLRDAPGLLTYLAQKMRYGRMPLYISGEEENPKQFASMHATQRHMVDTKQCRMAYDDNEEEYADFYDFSAQHQGSGEDLEMVAAGADPADLGSSGYEMAVPGDAEGSVKLLGSRQFSRFYRQKHRPADDRPGIVANVSAAKYRALGLVTQQPGKSPQVKQAQRMKKQAEFKQMKVQQKANVTRDLPRNVTY